MPTSNKINLVKGRVLGIDPGYDRLGVCVAQRVQSKIKINYSSCITTSKKDAHEKRLRFVGKQIETLFLKWKPEIFAIETLYITKNQKTASRVSEVRGIFIYIASLFDATICEYTPLHIKSVITGYGRAEKAQVAEIVKRTVNLTPRKRFDDEYDAIAVALTALYSNINRLSTE